MELVPSQEQSFEVKWRKCMVEPSQPLGHAIIIGVFCFKGELLVPMKCPINTGNRSKGETAICSDLSQCRIAISNEPKRRPIVQQVCRRLVRQRNQIVIKIRSSIRDLRSFHGKFARHIPWCLLEGSEGKPISLKLTGVGVSGIPKGTF